MSENEVKAKRKPVAAVVTARKDGPGSKDLIVVCDDGSTWCSSPIGMAAWDEMEPIPGTARERELLNASLTRS